MSSDLFGYPKDYSIFTGIFVLSNFKSSILLSSTSTASSYWAKKDEIEF